MPKRLTHAEFINRLDKLNPKITLNDGIYVNSKSYLKFNCDLGHVWIARPGKILSGTQCPVCSEQTKTEKRLHTNAWFIDQLNQLNISHIPLEVYKGGNVPILFKCNDNHKWNARPNNIIRGSGCPKCYGNFKHDTESFMLTMKKKQIKVELCKGEEYVNNKTKLKFLCKLGHEWMSTPTDILSGYGCPYCSKKPHSQLAVKWLMQISKKEKVLIMHAENGGEYIVPGSNYRADGFCESTNTIYEFHGDAFHGNPNKFRASDCCHPYDKNITAKVLYQRTKLKEQFIIDQGYNLVVMWELDFLVK